MAADTLDPASLPAAAPPTRRSRVTAQGALSRDRILDAALDTMSERGFSASSVDAICRQAGVVKTALYWHFGSKEGLLAAVLDRVSTEWIDEIRRSVDPSGAPLERLDAALAGIRHIVETRPLHLRLLLSVLLERSESDPVTRQTLGRIFTQARDALQHGLEDNLGRTIPGLEEIADTMLALMQSAALRRLAEPQSLDLDRLFAHVRRVTLLMVEDAIRRADVVSPTAS